MLLPHVRIHTITKYMHVTEGPHATRVLKFESFEF